MKAGSIVETVADFDLLRKTWGFPYPKKGDCLTVASVCKHHNPDSAKKGISLLTFAELPNLVPVSDKTIYGKDNFVELLLPDDIQEIINEPLHESICN